MSTSSTTSFYSMSSASSTTLPRIPSATTSQAEEQNSLSFYYDNPHLLPNREPARSYEPQTLFKFDEDIFKRPQSKRPIPEDDNVAPDDTTGLLNVAEDSLALLEKMREQSPSPLPSPVVAPDCAATLQTMAIRSLSLLEEMEEEAPMLLSTGFVDPEYITPDHAASLQDMAAKSLSLLEKMRAQSPSPLRSPLVGPSPGQAISLQDMAIGALSLLEKLKGEAAPAPAPTDFFSLSPELHDRIFGYVFAGQLHEPRNLIVASTPTGCPLDEVYDCIPAVPELAVSRRWRQIGMRSFFANATFDATIDTRFGHETNDKRLALIPDTEKALITSMRVKMMASSDDELLLAVGRVPNLRELSIVGMYKSYDFECRTIPDDGCISDDEIGKIPWLKALTEHPRLRHVSIAAHPSAPARLTTAARRMQAWLEIRLAAIRKSGDIYGWLEDPKTFVHDLELKEICSVITALKLFSEFATSDGMHRVAEMYKDEMEELMSYAAGEDEEWAAYLEEEVF